jgi:hypothetical protein
MLAFATSFTYLGLLRLVHSIPVANEPDEAVEARIRVRQRDDVVNGTYCPSSDGLKYGRRDSYEPLVDGFC